MLCLVWLRNVFGCVDSHLATVFESSHHDFLGSANTLYILAFLATVRQLVEWFE